MRKPDAVFTVHICPAYSVTSCDAKRAEEDRGLMGFHNFTSCPDCRVIDRGWEFWGQNGFIQGSAPNRPRLLHWLKLKAKEQWKTKSGETMGYRFTRGRAQYYRA